MKKSLLGLVVLSAVLSGCEVSGGACADDLDCSEGYYCAADGFCSDLRDYEYCNTGDDCVDQLCLTVETTAGTVGNFCSVACDIHDDCPGNRGLAGACYSPTAADDFICFQTCVADGDCEGGSRCIGVTRDDGLADYICIPGA
jgi:hypothetical protein